MCLAVFRSVILILLCYLTSILQEDTSAESRVSPKALDEAGANLIPSSLDGRGKFFKQKLFACISKCLYLSSLEY